MTIRLESKESTILGAGMGLFTKDFIPANSILFPSFSWNGQMNGKFDQDYDQNAKNRMVNHSEMPNLTSFWDGAVMWKKTKRDIKAGEELFSDYRHTMSILPYPPSKSFLDF